MKKTLLPAIALSLLAATAVQAQAVCDGRFATITATDADDVITGSAGDDVIFGGGGNDVIDGGEGNDVICGGAGDDTLIGSAGDDVMIGGDGNDTLMGGAGDDVLQGDAGNDSCAGGPGVDSGDSSCETIQDMDVDIVAVTLRAADGTALAGELYIPAGEQAATGTRRVAMLHSHGAQSSYASGVPRLAGVHGAQRGFTVLALNRRDWGVEAGGGDTLFEDATRDLSVGMDFLELMGFDRVFIGGHSQGTTNAAVYPGYVADQRLVGIGLYGAISDCRLSARNVVFFGYYDDHVALAEQLVAAGETTARTVIGWDTAFGQQIFRSPRAFLSYYGPDALCVPEREITKSPVPVLLLRADGDLFTIGPWSRAVRDAALGAGVDATYTILPYPDTEFDVSNFGANAHSFVGLGPALVETTLDWLALRFPQVMEYTTDIAWPQVDGGNYLPYAWVGPDRVSPGNSLLLDGQRSTDIDGEIVAYQWAVVSGAGITIDDPASPTPTVSATGFGEQTATVELTVTDDAGGRASATLQVALDGGEPPPPANPATGTRSSSGGSALDLLVLLVLCLAARRRLDSCTSGFGRNLLRG